MLHEILVAMGSRTPELLRVLLREARGIELAGVEPQPGPQSVVNLNHPPYAADAVLLERHGDRIVSGLVYEVQLTKAEEKRIAWPIYMAVLRGTYEVPIRVVVLTISRAVARWAAEPIVLDGGSSIIVPTVIGPDQIPSIDDPGRPPPLPELAVLSTMAHGRGRSAEAIGRAALAAIDPLDPDARTL